MVGSISATAVFVESLPAPPQLMVARPPPSLHHHGGYHGGDDRGRVLALATRVERIAAVNRQVSSRSVALALHAGAAVALLRSSAVATGNECWSGRAQVSSPKQEWEVEAKVAFVVLSCRRWSPLTSHLSPLTSSDSRRLLSSMALTDRPISLPENSSATLNTRSASKRWLRRDVG